MIFNRFTGGARLCVEAAVEEARALGHDSIGEEALLLGVLAADDDIGAEALGSLGVSLEAAREGAKELFSDALASVGISFDAVRDRAGEGFDMRNSSPGRLAFSPRAKRALEQALREALRLRDDRITGEHILRGALRDEHGHAVRLLAKLGVSVESIESRLDQLRQQSPAS